MNKILKILVVISVFSILGCTNKMHWDLRGRRVSNYTPSQETVTSSKLADVTIVAADDNAVYFSVENKVNEKIEIVWNEVFISEEKAFDHGQKAVIPLEFQKNEVIKPKETKVLGAYSSRNIKYGLEWYELKMEYPVTLKLKITNGKFSEDVVINVGRTKWSKEDWKDDIYKNSSSTEIIEDASSSSYVTEGTWQKPNLVEDMKGDYPPEVYGDKRKSIVDKVDILKKY